MSKVYSMFRANSVEEDFEQAREAVVRIAQDSTNAGDRFYAKL
jgi:hypothetical protein